MRLNTATVHRAQTHEGGRADAHQNPASELERAVATCLLWENTFYEKGEGVADRIASLCAQVPAETIAELAVKACNDYKLRHVPLFLCVQLCKLASGRKDGLVSKTIAQVVQRPDEMGELISLYRKEKRIPLSGQLKKGLRAAFGKFSEYQFSKWNRDSAVKLRDVMFMVSPKPVDDERAALYKAIAENKLTAADTWEVSLSAGSDKKETWERLLTEKKLGYMALLMNLRNMEQVHVERSFVESALLEGARKSKALPFRFVSAAKHAPAYAQTLSEAMCLALTDAPKLKGSTLLLVDVSGSMDAPVSGKSELMRLDAAGALGVLLREVCESCRVFTFSTALVEVQNFRGLPLLAGISQSQQHGGTELAGALRRLQGYIPKADRVIVITDEQSSDGNGANWTPRGYICNVAPYKPELETAGGWFRVNGWSERIVDWIRAEESLT